MKFDHIWLILMQTFFCQSIHLIKTYQWNYNQQSQYSINNNFHFFKIFFQFMIEDVFKPFIQNNLALSYIAMLYLILALISVDQNNICQINEIHHAWAVRHLLNNNNTNNKPLFQLIYTNLKKMYLLFFDEKVPCVARFLFSS